MKVFLTAAVLAIALATGSAYVLSAYQQRADEAFASASGVRLPDHGTFQNLVGNDWRPAVR